MKKPILIGTLFILTLVVSVFLHLPASWVLSQPQVMKQLPPNLQLSNVEGAWWRGESSVNLRQAGQPYPKSLGQVKWRLNWSSLVTLSPSVKLKWKQAKQSVVLTVQADSSSGNLILEEVNGRVKLNYLAQFLPNVGALLSDAKGDLRLKKIHAVLAFKNNQAWPQALDGKITLLGMAAMGAQIERLDITPTLDNNRVKLAMDGGGDGWKLKGQVLLSANRQQQTNLTLRADSKNTMPDWVALVMPMKNPTLAELNQNGRW